MAELRGKSHRALIVTDDVGGTIDAYVAPVESDSITLSVQLGRYRSLRVETRLVDEETAKMLDDWRSGVGAGLYRHRESRA
jgi:hypothetical protein